MANGNGKNGLVKMGRPTRYTKGLCEVVYRLCLLNATDEQIAGCLGIAEKTLNNWKLRYPDLLQSLKKGKIHADARVADALYHRAVGYNCKETKVFCSNGVIITKEITKHYPPDPTSMCFWLKNRAGWKDRLDFVVEDETLSEDECENVRELLKLQEGGKE